jgi:hypothetical protein
MSEKRCAVCGKVLEPVEVRVVERNRGVSKRRSRYMCTVCRKREYENYVKSIKDLVEKNSVRG